MALNPDTGRFENLTEPEFGQSDRMEVLANEIEGRFDEVERIAASPNGLVRPDGSPVPNDWPIFSMEELIVIKGASFRVAYIGDTAILFEPCKPD